MAKIERIDQEPERIVPIHIESGKERRALSKVRRELSEKELSQSGSQRFLLAELDRLEKEVIILSEFRDQFHKSEKEKAVLEEKVKSYKSNEILYALCLTMGSILIGLYPTMVDKIPYGGLISLGIGIVLIAVAIISKLVKI